MKIFLLLLATLIAISNGHVFAHTPAPPHAQPIDLGRPNGVASESCRFSGVDFENSVIYAAGELSGRSLDFQIDQSGQMATQMDVTVHSPDKAVILMLGAYEPTIWNIKWSKQTKISAVVASGYHRQAIAGLAASVPTLISTQHGNEPCGYFIVSEQELKYLNNHSRKMFGRGVDKVFFAKRGRVHVGEKLPTGTRLLTSSAVTPRSYYNQGAPLAGPTALKDAVRRGHLRRATQDDVWKWNDAIAEKMKNEDIPTVHPNGQSKRFKVDVSIAYVVLKPFKLPAGMYGGNMAQFYVPKGVAFPSGELGHSTIYDFNTLTCTGSLCDHAASPIFIETKY